LFIVGVEDLGVAADALRGAMTIPTLHAIRVTMLRSRAVFTF
jgi:hypothetical protein